MKNNPVEMYDDKYTSINIPIKPVIKVIESITMRVFFELNLFINL